MRTFLTSLILVLCGVVAYLWFRPYTPPAGKVIVSQSWLDSLYSVANQPPETLRVVTPAPPDTVTVVKMLPTPIYVDSTKVAYHDSLVNEQFSIHVFDTIQKVTGRIISRTWQSRLFVPLRVTEYITKQVPMPYPVNTPPKEWRYYGTVWIGKGIQGEVGVIYKDRWKMGTKAGLNSIEVGAGVIFN